VRILRTTQSLPKETLQWEPFDGYDGEGKPSYGSPLDFEANVLEYDPSGFSGRTFVTNADGSVTHVPLCLYIQGDEENVPNQEDRVTLGDDRTFIVVDKKIVHGLRYTHAQPDHYRLRCRIE
jgi:hypothetical protein